MIRVERHGEPCEGWRSAWLPPPQPCKPHRVGRGSETLAIGGLRTRTVPLRLPHKSSPERGKRPSRRCMTRTNAGSADARTGLRESAPLGFGRCMAEAGERASNRRSLASYKSRGAGADRTPDPAKPLRLHPSPVKSETRWFAVNGWWARQDSNLQPDRYERSALTIELQALRVLTKGDLRRASSTSAANSSRICQSSLVCPEKCSSLGYGLVPCRAWRRLWSSTYANSRSD